MRFEGYHVALPQPFRPGELVVIPKGTPIMSRQGLREAKRTYVVKVNHTLPGRSISCYDALKDSRYRADLEKRGFDFAALEKAYEENPQAFHLGSVALDNPQVRWAGAGGYWNAVDVNHILTANGITDHAE